MNSHSSKSGPDAKGLKPMPEPIVIVRQVLRVALIVVQTGNELVRVAMPIVRALSGKNHKR